MTFKQSENFREQELADAIKWHRAVNPKLTEADFAKFAAGFNDGYRKALAAVKMHGAPGKTS